MIWPQLLRLTPLLVSCARHKNIEQPHPLFTQDDLSWDCSPTWLTHSCPPQDLRIATTEGTDDFAITALVLHFSSGGVEHGLFRLNICSLPLDALKLSEVQADDLSDVPHWPLDFLCSICILIKTLLVCQFHQSIFIKLKDFSFFFTLHFHETFMTYCSMYHVRLNYQIYFLQTASAANALSFTLHSTSTCRSIIAKSSSFDFKPITHICFA